MGIPLESLPKHIRTKILGCQDSGSAPGRKRIASRAETDGFDSETERRYADELELKRRSGLIRTFSHHRQKFKVGEKKGGRGTWYTPDFEIVHNDGSFEYVEIKGEFIRERGLSVFRTARMLYRNRKWTMLQWIDGAWIEKE